MVFGTMSDSQIRRSSSLAITSKLSWPTGRCHQDSNDVRYDLAMLVIHTRTHVLTRSLTHCLILCLRTHHALPLCDDRFTWMNRTFTSTMRIIGRTYTTRATASTNELATYEGAGGGVSYLLFRALTRAFPRADDRWRTKQAWWTSHSGCSALGLGRQRSSETRQRR